MQNFINHQGKNCFWRQIGISQNMLQNIAAMDMQLSKQGEYQRITEFSSPTDARQIAEYQKQYQMRIQNHDKYYMQVLNLYHAAVPNTIATIERNLMVSVLHWEKLYISPNCPAGRKKLVCSGKIGYKEYLSSSSKKTPTSIGGG